MLPAIEEYRSEIFSLIAWLVWNRHNALRPGKSVQPAQLLPSLAGSILQDFLNAQVSDHGPIQASRFKGAIFKNIDAAGLGIVIRDSNSEVMGDTSQRVPLPQTVVKVEALACRRAVSFAIELGLRELVIEGDQVLVIQAIKDGQPCQSFYGHIVDDIFHLSAQLRNFTFCHVNRNCNRVADALAKKSQVGLDFQEWVRFSGMG